MPSRLIGNKKAVKAFLPELIAWQKARGFPFLLTTEASLNIAEDSALMTMMAEANFIGFFVGIESPDPETLRHMSKKQNIKHQISVSIQRVYEHGLVVLPGMILGFDTEKPGAAEAMLACIEEAPMPVALLSLLYALPGTQLTRRLEKEGRLHSGIGIDTDRRQGDFTLAGLNFETKRPRVEILEDFITVLERIYEAKPFFARAKRSTLAIRRPKMPVLAAARESLREIHRFYGIMKAVTLGRPDMRWLSWALIIECFVRNPRAVRNAVAMVVFYYYLVPLSRIWIAEAKRQIEEIHQSEAAAATTVVPIDLTEQVPRRSLQLS